MLETTKDYTMNQDNRGELFEYAGEDYVHSANTLFHFVNSSSYLIDDLQRKALCPRYCVEDVGYLNLRIGDRSIKETAVLQKCFCDIPLHTVVKPFPIQLTKNNTNLTDDQKSLIEKEVSHPELYGQYGIAFSKQWCENNKLQPIHYLNEHSDIVSAFSDLFNGMVSKDDLADEIADGLIKWMCFLKPLHGTMNRRYPRDDRFVYEIYKNFHDEHEWRFVPFNVNDTDSHYEAVIANPKIKSDILNRLSNAIAEPRFKHIWLHFEYSDIRYIIVPDYKGRAEIINTISNLNKDAFTEEDADFERSNLISKILVLDEVKKDF